MTNRKDPKQKFWKISKWSVGKTKRVRLRWTTVRKIQKSWMSIYVSSSIQETISLKHLVQCWARNRCSMSIREYRRLLFNGIMQSPWFSFLFLTLSGMVGRTQLPILLWIQSEALTTACKILYDLQPTHFLDSFPITLPYLLSKPDLLVFLK